MDKEILELLKEMQKDIKDLKVGQGRLEEGQHRLETGQSKLEEGQQKIRMLLEELEPKNANRHLELKESIKELRKDVNNVEIITSSNWNDIAKLKSIK
ncbi:hypothetical protein NSA47_14600 [Irregularibacter muris]|uniref:Uncharacterized protein n=1 Tax=Irregularibacter muris TaxID=1796619 RepID=A0AAE3L3C0_9FIRM|nr:hypothetical protein [Irregularibacter muris]MCR1900194.1 hypothetical protein [Irregularibacter muris]